MKNCPTCLQINARRSYKPDRKNTSFLVDLHKRCYFAQQGLCAFSSQHNTALPSHTTQNITMTLTLYEITIPVFITNLKTVSKLVEKGRLHFSTNESALLESKLIADMDGFIAQIQRISDTAKGVAVRSGGVAAISLPDDETTFPQLEERIQKTIKILESVKEADMNSSEEKEIVLQSQKFGAIKMTGKEYILKYAIPNFFFHVCMTYAILRKEGVDVGKNNYLGRV